MIEEMVAGSLIQIRTFAGYLKSTGETSCPWQHPTRVKM